MYKILSAGSARSLRIETEGFWSVDVVKQYLAELEGKLVDLHRRYGAIDLLVDIRSGSPLPQDSATYLADGMKTLGEKYIRKMAYIVPSTLHVLQVRRLLESDIFVHKEFRTEQEALAWLAER